MKFQCFDVVKMVLEEANDRFSPLFVPVQERVDILKQYCSALDNLMERGDAESFDCEIDEDDMTVHLDIVVMDVTVDDPEHDEFQDLVERANSVKITNENGEYIRVSFVFPSLWERA